MKNPTKVLIILILLSMMLMSACGNASGTADTGTQTPADSPGSVTSSTPKPTDTPQPSEDSTPEPAPSEEPGLGKVVLSNGANSVGNHHFASEHYGIYPAYTSEYVVMINYMTMMMHGNDISMAPEIIEGFEYQGEGLQYYNGLLYFMMYDWDNGVYYLYSYDFENDPVKAMDSTVHHYEFINGKIYYTKQFVQGPIFSADLTGSGEQQVTTMRAHSFTSDGQALYFYATDAGTAPGLVKYDLSSNEETTVVFPFYSHNYMVQGGYVYYVMDNSSHRSIHRMSLTDQSVTDIAPELFEYTVSLNISDGVLFVLTENGIKSYGLDGGNMKTVYESIEYLTTGLYIFGNRIYFTDGAYLYMVKKDGSDLISFELN